jgi:hypothetical protein
MKKNLLYFLFILFLIPVAAKAQFETYKDSVVQLYGVVMTADSLKALPSVSIMVKGRNQGTISSEQGVFSIPVLRGDVIEFTSVGYKPKLYTIPKNLDGNQQSVIQLMVEDTVYLPVTIITKRPSREEFERDFVNTKVPDDQQEIARQNLSEKNLRALMAEKLLTIILNKMLKNITLQGNFLHKIFSTRLHGQSLLKHGSVETSKINQEINT